MPQKPEGRKSKPKRGPSPVPVFDKTGKNVQVRLSESHRAMNRVNAPGQNNIPAGGRPATTRATLGGPGGVVQTVTRGKPAPVKKATKPAGSRKPPPPKAKRYVRLETFYVPGQAKETKPLRPLQSRGTQAASSRLQAQAAAAKKTAATKNIAAKRKGK
jgi:hypothetical protein